MLDRFQALVVFGLIEAYIWRLRYTAGWTWILILTAILLTHVLHHETPRQLGFRIDNFRDAARQYGPAVAALAIGILLCGVAAHGIRPMTLGHALGSILLYLPWGILQQYLLNGYFANRFDSPFAAATLFAAAHYPNPFLMTVTFILGYAAALAYRRRPNLYFLGLAHGIIGFLLYLAVPDSLSHHLNVGPGYR